MSFLSFGVNPIDTTWGNALSNSLSSSRRARQLVVAVLPGHGHRPDRDRDQLHGRRPARRPRPAGPGMTRTGVTEVPTPPRRLRGSHRRAPEAPKVLGAPPPGVLLEVRDLRTVLPRHGRRSSRPSTASPSRSAAARRWASSASPAAARASRRSRSCACSTSRRPRSPSGEILFEGRDLLDAEDEMRTVRGNDIAMIFQEPMTSLNPVFTIGDQIAEQVQLHLKVVEEGGLGQGHRGPDAWSGSTTRSGASSSTRTRCRAACASGS